jgi:DNA helicase-2/ATP-dependent DNA helicase PcrA
MPMSMDIPRYLRDHRGILLSDQQQAAVEAVSGDVLLLAVPGAGKTTVLTARIANLMANHYTDPQRLLILTFNRESARDMARRWERLFGDLFPRDPAFSTIHSFCLRLLGEYAAGRGTQVPELLEGRGKGREGVLRDIYRELTGEFLTDEALGRAVNAMGYCVNMRLTPEERERFSRIVPQFPRLFLRYTAWKRKNALMDFDDMLLFANTALERTPALRERFAGRYDYILVDEAQDTSRLQHSILEQLGRKNLFLVGDEDQSIYGFRGAWPQGLLQFFQGHPEGKLLKLEENYRSTAAIVDGASRLIQGNRQRYPKAIFTRREEGKPIGILRDLDHSEQYEAIADLVERLPQGETCAVLYRTGFSGIGLGRVFRRRGIPFFSRESRLGYASDAITREVSNLMILADRPGDPDAFRRCWFLLPCTIPKAAAEEAIRAGERDLLRYVLEEVSFASKNTGRLAWVHRVLDRMKNQPPARQLKTILGELEYLEFLDHRCQESYDRNAYLQKLSVLAQIAAESPDTETFLRETAAAGEVLDCPEPQPVTLSTVHSAKGQEFDRVIIADALEGVFPAADALGARAGGDPQPLEEEARLFYTAMTRARNRLVIFAPKACLGQPLMSSRFLRPVEGAGAPVVKGIPLTPGLRIAHAYYGVGSLEKAEGGKLTVTFRHYGTKRFSIKQLEAGKELVIC